MSTPSNDFIIHYAFHNTTLGLMIMATTDNGVCSVQFGDTEESLITMLKKTFPHTESITLATKNDDSKLSHWMVDLDRYLSQKIRSLPEIPLDMIGTAFQIRIWQCLLHIEKGQTLSYLDIAESIHNPKSVRAVGTACGKNPIAVLIPCHRVIRSDGQLGGYRWGLERKQTLLMNEQNHVTRDRN